jgi:hypothetical protein
MEDRVSKYDQLYEKYPELVKAGFGDFCIGEGWYDLIDTLCGSIVSIVKQHNESVEYRLKQIEEGKRSAGEYSAELLTMMDMPVIQQVKEKFGGLRFYISGGDKRIQHYVEFAELMSWRICEECGAPGERRTSTGWIHVMCDKHEEEYLAKRDRGEW